MSDHRSAETGADCTCEVYVVDYSDPERYHPENLDREEDPACPVHAPSGPAWCLCGVVDDKGEGTCGNCGLRIMTDDDELSSPPEPVQP